MKKTLPLILLLPFVLTLLLSCQSENHTKKDTDENKLEQQMEVASKTDTAKIETNQQPEEDRKKLLFIENISKVKISELGKTKMIVLEDEESMKTIERIISDAVKEDGIVNMVNPNFKMFISSTNDESEQSFYLWIGEKGEKSTFMNSDDTNTIYTVSGQMTEDFIDLIEKQL